MTEFTDEMRPHFPQAVGSVPPRMIGANVLVLFFGSHAAAPYQVGSRWSIEVSDSGEIAVKPEDL